MADTAGEAQGAGVRIGFAGVCWDSDRGLVMSKLRPEVSSNNDRGLPCLRDGDAYVAIYNSVRGSTWGLIHGRLHDDFGHHCAIGSFWKNSPNMALPSALIDEVAAINDSCAMLTPKQRRNSVLRWLRWKLRTLGFGTPRK